MKITKRSQLKEGVTYYSSSVLRNLNPTFITCRVHSGFPYLNFPVFTTEIEANEYARLTELRAVKHRMAILKVEMHHLRDMRYPE